MSRKAFGKPRLKSRPESRPESKSKSKQLKLAVASQSAGVFNPQKRTTVASRRRRPIAMNQSIHLVLRSDRAKGKMSLRKHAGKIDRLTRRLARAHGVQIYKMANVGNHIHIHLRVTKRLLWKPFISGLTGGIARAVGFTRALAKTHLRAGGTENEGFWKSRPFSRIVSGRSDFLRIQDYVTLNQLEADGAVPPRSRMRKGASWRRIVEIMAEEGSYG